VRDLESTDVEQRFFIALSSRVDDLQDWYHVDDDGSPWMTVSYDFARDNAVIATLRCDWDGARLPGGWSPGLLDWDDGVRADVAGVITTPPDGLEVDVADPRDAAVVAGAWFEPHIRRGVAAM
jgi:hypothetical protein